MAVVINSVLFSSGYEEKNIISDGLWPLLSYCQHFFLITANAIKSYEQLLCLCMCPMPHMLYFFVPLSYIKA